MGVLVASKLWWLVKWVKPNIALAPKKEKAGCEYMAAESRDLRDTRLKKTLI